MRHTPQDLRRHRRPIRWAVLLTLTALTTAACSDGDSADPTASAPTTTTAAAPTTATTVPPTATTATTQAAPTTTTQAAPTPTTEAPATTATSPPPVNIAITIKGFIFQPGEVSVKPGTTIAWTNQDDILHTATSGAPAGTPDDRFNGEMDGKGKSFTVKLDQPGTYEYFCSRHNSMTGKIIVTS